jgi:hypothetical protein
MSFLDSLAQVRKPIQNYDVFEEKAGTKQMAVLQQNNRNSTQIYFQSIV